MRQKNWRLVIVGSVLIVLAIAFFFGMEIGLAPQSSDPKTMMETVGQVSGILIAIGVVMIAFGIIGKKQKI
ncbi:MAG TPA: hypothetical protein VHW02_02605 [Rhizomicrobium sp.]|jgi:hypothetical protein|nr:hypothetical protein [Rhizomicrobium sp.]